MPSLSTECSLILGYLKLCSRGASASKFDNSDSKFDVFCAKVWGFPAGKFDVEFELER